MKYSNKKNNLWLYILLIALIGFILAYFLILDKEKPQIKIKNEVSQQYTYWNLKNNLTVLISDESGIKSFEVTFSNDEGQIALDTKIVKQDSKNILLEISAPLSMTLANFKEGTLRISAFDNSKWNFFRGNEAIKTSNVIIDTKPPSVSIIGNTSLLIQGGSGILISKISDDNLQDCYVMFNDEVIFELFPFYKKNFYISIITWPIDIKEFKRVSVVAIDKAGNKTVTKVPFYIQSFKPKIDKLKISDKFVNEIAKKVLENSKMDIPLKPIDIFLKTNKELREENVKTLRKVALENIKESANIKFDIKPFQRLPKSAVFATFGERRYYYYGNEKIDEAWHLGIDWASFRNADIFVTNPGKVIFKDYLGIYGNTIIIDHGFGLSSLYAHTSTQNVQVGDLVQAGEHIANTGASGAVFGDHLHFGILVQGIEANPNEWLDKNWVDKYINNIIINSIKIIDGK